MRSLVRRYLRGEFSVVWVVLGGCEIIQGVAQHFTGKHYGWLPPWLQITVGSVVFLGNLGILAGHRWLPEPPPPPVEVPRFDTLPPRVTSVFIEYPLGRRPDA